MIKADTDKINNLLAEKEMSVSEAAKAAGISVSSLANLKNGKVSGSHKTIGKLAKALDVRPEEIIKEW